MSMTLEDLRVWIRENRINPIYMSVGRGLPGPFEQMCIVKEGDGWEVYYAERRNKVHLHVFDSEDAACRYFMAEVKAINSFRLKPEQE